MVGLVVRRVLVTVPLLIVVSFVVFSLVALIPGDAATTLAGGVDAPPAMIDDIRQEMNLDKPFLVQYTSWVGGVLHGDFGRSLYDHQPITSQLRRRLPVTLSLALLALLTIVLPLAIVAGVAGGLRPGSLLDRFILFFGSIGMSVPGFWVAMVLVGVFAVWLGWLPPFGYTHFSDGPWEWWKHLLLPALAVGFDSAFSLSRQLRGALADTMQASFIRTAWAKGGNARRVVVGHAFKNSAMPAVTVLGLRLGGILGGAVIIEQIFSLPGIGNYLLTAVNTQDVPVIQAAALMFVVTHVVASLLVDITYGFLNPKVRIT